MPYLIAPVGISKSLARRTSWIAADCYDLLLCL